MDEKAFRLAVGHCYRFICDKFTLHVRLKKVTSALMECSHTPEEIFQAVCGQDIGLVSQILVECPELANATINVIFHFKDYLLSIKLR